MSREGRATAARRKEQGRSRLWATVAGVGAGVLVLAIVVLLFLNPADSPPVDATAEDPFLGRENASVIVFYYADFQCPFCREFDVGGDLNALEADYGDRVRFVFKDYPIVGPDSWTAARASTFVWETAPGDYWAWHRAVFERQAGENDGWASADNLVAISRAYPSIDASALEAALDDGAYQDEVEGDSRDGRASGVRGTPTLVIDGKALNALDTEAVRGAIDDALARAEPAGAA